MNAQNSIDITLEEKKQKTIQKSIIDYKNNLTNVQKIIDSFQKVLKILKDDYLNIKLNPPFNIIDDKLKDFSSQLNKLLENIQNTIILTLTKLETNLDNFSKESANNFNILKNNISQEKEKLKKKALYESETNKGNKSKTNILEQENNIFNFSVNENYKQLYNYEIQLAREIISDEKIKYDKINNKIGLIIDDNEQINAIIAMFSKSINSFCEKLGMLAKNINDEMDKQFSLAKQENNKNLNTISTNENNTLKENNFNINLTLDTNNESDIQMNIENIIQAIINTETELKIKDIMNIINFLGININNQKKTNHKNYFIAKISELCENKLVFVKNKNNLIHIANILNSIILQDKPNINLFNQVILYSSRIRYKKIFLYELMVRKNIYFRTTTLWRSLINERLINKINRFIDNNYNEKNEEKDVDKKKKDVDKEQIKSLFKKLHIENEISKNIKKFNPYKLKDLLRFIQESTIVILSESIPEMMMFSVSVMKINEIIRKYKEKIDFNDLIKIYMEDIIFIHKLKLNKIELSSLNKDKRSEILILSALKFIPSKEYKNLFILNKNIYPILRKGLITNIFSKKDLNIQSHIKYIGECLSINNIKKSFNYNEIKQSTYNNYLERNKDDDKTKKKKQTIQNDLNRTKFIQDNPNHKNAIESILFSFYFTFNNVKYYQGMHSVVIFLYQLLDCDETNTFYYFFGLQFKTEYHFLFEDDFSSLNILFYVFEKIIKIQFPEIYLIFQSVKIDTNYFCSSWFITLFAGHFTIIDKDNPPLLEIFLLEKYCLNNWNSIFNLGLVILEFCHEKIFKLEQEELIKYIMNLITEENIFDNKNFEKCKRIYEKNEKLINDIFVDKLKKIASFEYQNKFLKNSD